MLKYRDGLAAMPTYDVVERPWKIKINANECNLNLPPLVEERVLSRLSRVAFNRYPNEEYDLLREQIAAAYNLTKENILLGSGSSEIIEKLFYSFGGRDGTIVYPRPSFSMYGIYAKAAESRGIAVDLAEDYAFDADKFVNAVNDNKATLAVICNPNNPTGTGIPLAAIERVAQNIDCALLLDEAYMEFYGESASELLTKYPHLIVARTFSKAYGLAAARVGYMLAAKDIVSTVEKSYMPYHLNVLSVATADIVYQMRYEYGPRIDQLIAETERLSAELKKLPGVTVYPSVTNFVLVRYAKAVELNEELAAQGIGVRSFNKTPRLENCLRISMGTREENDIWLKAVQDFVAREA
ncbi:MAG: histidinol-phosphate transaminase [Selenomonadaceae bacterium]|nr:histidinol-phosphate transaminase [Selenomonadaceae bacterium]